MTKVKCWYCGIERELGDNHMYHCVKALVDGK